MAENVGEEVGTGRGSLRVLRVWSGQRVENGVSTHISGGSLWPPEILSLPTV